MAIKYLQLRNKQQQQKYLLTNLATYFSNLWNFLLTYLVLLRLTSAAILVFHLFQFYLIKFSTINFDCYTTTITTMTTKLVVLRTFKGNQQNVAVVTLPKRFSNNKSYLLLQQFCSHVYNLLVKTTLRDGGGGGSGGPSVIQLYKTQRTHCEISKIEIRKAEYLRSFIIRLQGICIIRLISLLKRVFQIPHKNIKITINQVPRPKQKEIKFHYFSPSFFYSSQIRVVVQLKNFWYSFTRKKIQSWLPSNRRHSDSNSQSSNSKRNAVLASAKCVWNTFHVCGCVGKYALLSHLQRSLILLILLSTMWHGSECFHGSVKMGANTVKTKYGLLRGIVVRSSPLVEAYLGIPYASPPVGSLR